MRTTRLLLAAGLVAGMLGVVAAPASAEGIPSGERVFGQSVLEPVYEDTNGTIKYVKTPKGAPNPVNSNPRAAAPFYLPVYPTGSTVGTLVCKDVPEENCPDHGPGVAGLAQALEPAVYGEGVVGHDHLMAGPGSHGDFNIAWVPTLVLFTSKAAANSHVTTLAQIEEMREAGEVRVIALDGSNGLPNLTFHCSIAPEVQYLRASPFEG